MIEKIRKIKENRLSEEEKIFIDMVKNLRSRTNDPNYFVDAKNGDILFDKRENIKIFVSRYLFLKIYKYYQIKDINADWYDESMKLFEKMFKNYLGWDIKEIEMISDTTQDAWNIYNENYVG